ncbi:MAG: dienelactone hydrolase family protein, partial [Aestuariivirga sp.]|nr:dienelactone hydrolase family protein [Aestuariivirga sp.]
TAIPVNDPNVKEIAGALLKPEGPGPFPLVVYMPPCGGPNFPLELQQEKTWIERLNSEGIALFIVDPLMPRGLENGICDKLLTVLQDVKNRNETVLKIMETGGNDAAAAIRTAKTLPGIDPTKIFLMGFSSGGTASLYATDPNAPGDHVTDIGGVIAYYPLCYDNVKASVPTLILVGDKDDWISVSDCQALEGRENFEVVVYPGGTHAFTLPFDKPVDFVGHKMAYDEVLTKTAMERAVAFIAAQMK